MLLPTTLKSTNRNGRDPIRSLFDAFFTDQLPDLFPGERALRTSIPTNIAETDQAYVLSFEMPGVDEKDIDVRVHDRQLVISAERKEEEKTEGKTWHRVEQHYGQITRSILLPESVRTDAVDASYRQGILTVTVPKRPESQPRKVAIKG